MKIEINHPENISIPPLQKSFESPEQTQLYGNNPNSSLKNPKHFRKDLHPSKKSQLLPKNCQTGLPKISQPHPQKSQPGPSINSQTLSKNITSSTEKM